MAPSKVAKACKEMKKFGIAEESVKPVLKNLLDVYDKNWKYIEDENYRLLLNAIFDNQNSKKEELTKREFKLRDVPDECGPPIKEYRTRSERNKSSPSVIASSAGFVGTRLSSQPRVEALEFQSSELESGVKSSYRTSSMPPEDYKEKGRNSSAPHHCSSLGQRCPSRSFSDTESSDSCPEETYLPLQHRSKRRLTDEGGSNFVPDVDLTITPDFPGSMEKELYYHNEGLHEAMLFIDEMPGDEVPLAVIHPDHASSLNKEDFSKSLRSDSKEHAEVFSELMDLDADDKLDEDGSSHEHHSDANEYDSKSFELITSNAEHNSTLQLLNKACSSNKSSSGLRMIDSDYLNEGVKDDSQSQIELSSSHNEVEISLTINSSAPSNFNLPSLDAVFKAVEVCECFSAAKSIETDDEQVDTITVQPTVNVIKESNQLTVLDERIDKMDKPHSSVFQMENDFMFITSFKGNTDGYVGRSVMAEGYGKTNSREIVLKQGTSLDNLLTATYFVDDITRGEETNKISLVNEINNECQPTFYYISKNITYQNAYVKFLLARISDENCCSNCVGDCMSLEIPCACAGETGGEFAYTAHGLVKDDFLQRCFSVNLNHEKNLFYCKDCPLQRSNDDKFSNKCSGHIVRKFIKECWYKCGCGKSCGNRVIQRGISANLQVFMTPEGKGWGLRTLEDLPKGSFICEYVGEIVTNTELDDRNKRNVGEKHTYPVLLDADWGSEGVLKDEEALCLDATNYGNVARFINHRCKDANMVEIPVEVETPDHHYYHLAFFTIRDVKALEELTWDYGIDFGDTSHPIKAFNCRCGSKFCKSKRRKRPRTSY